jgi:hypothetical protein
MINLNPAYLAGVFDSDGSFSVIKRNFTEKHCNYNALMQLSWKKTDLSSTLINAIAEEFGGSVGDCASSNTHKSFPGTKDYLKYCVQGKKAAILAKTLLPFLVLKKRQAENLIVLIEKTSIFKGTKQKLITDELHEIYLLNKSLNTKNGWKNAKDNIR